MPTHWESSERPLFVKTVIVNGSRHAILSQVDPLCHLTSSTRKIDNFPTSCQTCTTANNFSCFEMKSSIREESRNVRCHLPVRRVRSCYQSKRDISSDLQNCLIKLQLVLSAQDKKKMKKEWSCLEDEKKIQNDCGKNIGKQWNTERMQRSKISMASFELSVNGKMGKETETAGYKKLQNRYSMNGSDEEYFCLEDVTELSKTTFSNSVSRTAEFREYNKENLINYEKNMRRRNSIKKMSPFTECTEKILKKYSNYFFPILCLENDMTWENVSSGNYFTKNFYNPLSDRVLQWLDLARRKERLARENSGNIASDNEEQLATHKKFLNFNKLNRNIEIKKTKSCDRKCENDVNYQRLKEFSKEVQFQKTSKLCDEHKDIDDEVKQECDVQSALSTTSQDYTKYSKEFNKFHETESSRDNQSFIMNIIGQFSNTNNEMITQNDHNFSNVIYSDGFLLNSSLLAIPEKLSSKSPFTEKLQKSILDSFEAIVNIDPNAEPYESNDIERKSCESSDYVSVKKVRKNCLQRAVKYESKLARKKGSPIRRKNFRFPSDEDEENDYYLSNENEYFMTHADNDKSNRYHLGRKKSNGSLRDNNEKRIVIEKKCKCHGLVMKDCNDENTESSKEINHEIQLIYNKVPLNAQMQKTNWNLKESEISGKKMWTKEKAGTKPQLHIFMPGIDSRLLEVDTSDESASDTESLKK